MSLAPPVTVNVSNATGSGRTKVALTPGHSLMDWVRLCGDKSKDLTGVGGPGTYGPVSEEDLEQKNSEDNAWITIKGRVYNITPYLEFHPGGVDEIMRGAGKDGTQLFNEIHKWVNVESMLASCYIGPLKEKPKRARKTKTENRSQLAASPMTLQVPQPTASTLSSSPQKPKKLGRILAAVSRKTGKFRRKLSDQPNVTDVATLSRGFPSSCPSSPSKMGQRLSREKRSSSVPGLFQIQKGTPKEEEEAIIPQPTYDWEQTDRNLTITLRSNYKMLDEGDVVVDVEKATRLTITVYVGSLMYQISGDIFAAVADLSVDFVDKRCDVRLTKQENEHWPVLHKDIPLIVTFTRRKNSEIKYYECTVRDVKQVTHDTKLFLVEFPPLTYVSVPVGHHVYLRHWVQGFEVTRPYTPVTNLQGDIGFEKGRSILLMIKIYPSGSLTQSLMKVDKGSTIEVSSHDGTFVGERLDQISTLCLVGAGSGFTPMAKLIRRFLEKSESLEGVDCGTARRVKLLCANKTEDDRMWQKELDALQASSNGRFDVQHALSRPSPEWSGLKGRVTKQMLEDFFPSSDQGNVLVCYCGNLAFNVLIRRLLRQLGFGDEQSHLFS